jgi:hypothetical protein
VGLSALRCCAWANRNRRDLDLLSSQIITIKSEMAISISLRRTLLPV